MFSLDDSPHPTVKLGALALSGLDEVVKNQNVHPVSCYPILRGRSENKSEG